MNAWKRISKKCRGFGSRLWVKHAMLRPVSGFFTIMSETFGIALVLSIWFYYGLDALVQRGYAYFLPKFYESLKDKDTYFGFLMGMLMVILTTPFLIHQSFFDPFSLGMLNQTLFAMRMMIFLVEVPRLKQYSLIVVHHIGGTIVTLWSLVSQRTFGLIWFFTLLVTEIPGDLIYLYSAHGKNGTKWYQHLVLFNLIQYVLVRVLGSLAVLIYSLYQFPLTTMELVWAILFAVLYATYLLTYVWKQFKKVLSMRKRESSERVSAAILDGIL
jgi:hypothetical protein